MFKKAISALSFAAAAFGLAAFSAPAAACTNTVDSWDCIHTPGGDEKQVSATYSGSATLSHWFTGTFWCNDVQAKGSVTIDDPSSGHATLRITGFDSSNSTSNAKCSAVGFNDFDWVGSHDGIGSPNSEFDTTPVNFEVYTPRITYSGITVCQDSVTVVYQNDGAGGSSFSFDDVISGWAGNCSIEGKLDNANYSAH